MPGEAPERPQIRWEPSPARCPIEDAHLNFQAGSESLPAKGQWPFPSLRVAAGFRRWPFSAPLLTGKLPASSVEGLADPARDSQRLWKDKIAPPPLQWRPFCKDRSAEAISSCPKLNNHVASWKEGYIPKPRQSRTAFPEAEKIPQFLPLPKSESSFMSFQFPLLQRAIGHEDFLEDNPSPELKRAWGNSNTVHKTGIARADSRVVRRAPVHDVEHIEAFKSKLQLSRFRMAQRDVLEY